MAQGTQTRLTAQLGRPWGRAVFLLLCVGVTAALTARGLDFYLLSLDARVDHPDFRVLGPAASWGHGYGVVGTLLILTNLLYLPRRRLAALPIGSMRAWLDMHVVTGLVGSIFVVFHSAFQLRSGIAMATSASLAIVVLTGVVGRYLYSIAPSRDPQRLATNLVALDELVPGMGKLIEKELGKNEPSAIPGDASLARVLGQVPTWMGQVRVRRAAVMEAYHETTRPRTLGPDELQMAKRIARQTAGLAAADVRSVAGTALLRTWRGLHRFLAILLILTVSTHIGVAWHFGFRWIFSE